MATAGRISGTVFQALRHSGQERVGEDVLAVLRRRLSADDQQVIRKDLIHAPGWIANVLRPLVESPSAR